MRVRDADDHLSLIALSRDAEIAAMATNRPAVRLLWEVCQIPDFRKVLSDAHTRLLSQIYRHLMTPEARLPEEWVAKQVARMDKTEGDIDTLVSRIAHIRTWTYISHRPDWLTDPRHWQERARAIEDKLSDALHERLTQRFVDRRSAVLARTLAGGGELLAAVTAAGEVLVEGHHVGRLEGFHFTLDPEVREDDVRAFMSAARRALKDEIGRRVRLLEQAADDTIELRPDGVLCWQGHPVARLGSGPSILTPSVVPLHDDLFESGQRDRVRARLSRWVEAFIKDRLAPLFRLRDAELSGPARGLAFQLSEVAGRPVASGSGVADRRPQQGRPAGAGEAGRPAGDQSGLHAGPDQAARGRDARAAVGRAARRPRRDAAAAADSAGRQGFGGDRRGAAGFLGSGGLSADGTASLAGRYPGAAGAGAVQAVQRGAADGGAGTGSDDRQHGRGSGRRAGRHGLSPP